MKVIQVSGHEGVVEVWGVRRTTDLTMVEPVKEGEFVLVHAGFAIEKIDEEEAHKTIELFNEIKEDWARQSIEMENAPSMIKKKESTS